MHTVRPSSLFFAIVLIIAMTFSVFGSAPNVQAQDLTPPTPGAQDEVAPRYRHAEVPPPSPAHPPTETNLIQSGTNMTVPSAPPASQGEVSAQSATTGLSFRYLQTFGENSEPYTVDTAHLNRPSGIFVDGSGNLFVTEERGYRVLKFNSSGAITTPTLGVAGIPWGHEQYVSNPRDVVTDGGGNIWVMMNPAVKKFSPLGTPMETFPFGNEFSQSGSDNAHLGNEPWGLALGHGVGDYLYVSDTNNNRIQIFDVSGDPGPDPENPDPTITYVATIGTGNRETDNSGFSYPTRIAFDSLNNLYVMDSDNYRIQQCSSVDFTDPVTNPWTCTTFFGETDVWGSDLTHLGWASGIAIDADDNIFVADGDNYRVLRYDDTLAEWVVFAGISTEDGSDNARFAYPSDVALSLDGFGNLQNVYVSDTDNSRVQKFSSAGVYQSTLGVTGVPYLTDTTHIYDPQGVAVAPDGSMYVTESSGNRLLKFNAAGVQQWTVGEPGIGGYYLGRAGGGGLQGNPAIDAGGRIYVADSDNNRVQIFNSNGTYNNTIGGNWGYGTYKFRCMGGVAISPVTAAGAVAGDIFVVDRCNQRVQVYTSARVYKATLGVTNEQGSDSDHFRWPWGVAVDSLGNIYVGDSNNYRVQKCTLAGGCSTFAGETGVQGGDFGHFQHPEQVAVDSLNRVYVADSWYPRVQVFDSDGNYLTTIGGGWGAETGNMTSPRGLAVDTSGDVYVSDSDTHRVQKFARGTPNWTQVNINGFGDINQKWLLAMAEFGGKLYAGGGKIWESSADGTTWTDVMSDGFVASGDTTGTNVNIESLLAYGGYLYAGTGNYYGENWEFTNGGQLWRSLDGSTWTEVTPQVADGFDATANSEFSQFTEFNGYFYASTVPFDSHGVDVWRCQTCDGTDWEKVSADGFGDGANSGIYSSASFGGYLYLGTWNTNTGGEVWRTNGGDAPLTWAKVNDSGFGDVGNPAVSSLSAFGGYLYAATDSRDDQNKEPPDPLTGAEVWRCQVCDNTDWVQVVDDGLGDSHSQLRSSLAQLGSSLYLVLGNNDTGLDVWRTLNGTAWIQSATEGFGNRNNRSSYFDNSVAVLGSNLYVGVVNNTNGIQIWRTSSNQQIYTSTFLSNATYDGWILESGEKTNKGGTMNSKLLSLGDDAKKKQYRGVLSFSTGADLPDGATITKVTLKVKKQSIVGGGNPVTTFKGFMADMKKGYFGKAALELGDFAFSTGVKTYGPFKPAPVSDWYTINLSSGQANINKTSASSGLTQIRLRFSLDDNNDAKANVLNLYSGNASGSLRPQLIIEYYVP